MDIDVQGLSKSFGSGVLAVDGLSFRVEPGRVTGFLGPNGAGKTTTLRCLLGLVRPTAGSALIGGSPYTDLDHPTRVVGAALEASGFHPGRSGRDHLRVRCSAIGEKPQRADELLEFVGLADAAGRRAGGYSLGMRQRLALALALVGDPSVLVLDEPSNGLDPAGIAWLRQFLRTLASQGRTILVSSHLLAEVRQTVDDVVIIDRGRLVRAGPLAEITGTHATVAVAGPDLTVLEAPLAAAGLSFTRDGSGLIVEGATAAEVGALAHRYRCELHLLVDREPELERVFLSLTNEGTDSETLPGPGGAA